MQEGCSSGSIARQQCRAAAPPPPPARPPWAQRVAPQVAQRCTTPLLRTASWPHLTAERPKPGTGSCLQVYAALLRWAAQPRRPDWPPYMGPLLTADAIIVVGVRSKLCSVWMQVATDSWSAAALTRLLEHGRCAVAWRRVPAGGGIASLRHSTTSYRPSLPHDLAGEQRRPLKRRSWAPPA